MPRPVEMAYEAPPEDGGIIEISPGVLWLRMPLPMVGLNHINLWILEEEDGWTVVDTGVQSDQTYEVWEEVIAKHLKGKPVTRVICTHFHPDHMGVAGWFVEEKKTEFWTSRCEWMLAVALSAHREQNWRESGRRFYARAGAEKRITDVFINGDNPYDSQVHRIPAFYHRIRDGEEIKIGGSGWKVMTGHGHSPEHVCLFNEEKNLLISGDIILPRISPNQGVWPSEPDQDPLGDYLGCLDKFDALPEDVLALPSHGLPFRGVHTRMEELRHHHDDRLDVATKACGNGATSWEVLATLFSPDLPDMHKILALSETIAHLNYLVNAGRITRTLEGSTWIYKS